MPGLRFLARTVGRASRPVLPCALCAVALVGLAWSALQAAPSMQELLKKQTTTKAKKAEAQRKLHELKQQQRSALEELRDTEVALGRAERDLAVLGRQLRDTTRKLETTKTELTAVETRLTEHTDLLGSRLRAVYKNGGMGYLELLLSAQSFSHFIRRAYLFRKIIEYDTALVRSIKDEKAQVEQRKQELEEEREREQRLKAQYAVRAALVERQKDKRKATFDEITRDRQNFERYVKKLAEESRYIENLIRARSRPTGSSADVKPWRGGFIRPVNGRLTSSFGYRTHPIFKVRRLHTGVDWAVPTGTSIKAAAGGKVISAGTLRGYGKTVILDHGGGRSTVYAHCSRVLVSSGQVVKQGQVIAKVGSTGLSTGPHLHFEVRINGKPVNPQTYR